jgi:hypothetical protein
MANMNNSTRAFELAFIADAVDAPEPAVSWAEVMSVLAMGAGPVTIQVADD